MAHSNSSSFEEKGDFVTEQYVTKETIATEKIEDSYALDEKNEHNVSGSILHEEELEDSPIEEVRAVVPNTDDPTLPVWTFRSVSMGLVFTVALGFINQFFWYRQEALTVSGLVVQLICYPIGVFMAKIIPKHKFFNPGPFNMKEHVIITIMGSCAANYAYAVDIITIQRIFYGQNIGWGGGLLLIWTTQITGYGMAGLLRPFLVYPSAMIWPSNLSNIALFRSLHVVEKDWTGPSRFRWFLYVFCGMFVYYWIPGYFFTILTFFSWACWIKPSNIVLNQLTGGFSGLGMLALSFDWSTITSYLLSPLTVPYWAIANITAGFIIIAWLIVPAMYYSNVWDAKTFPILTSSLFTTTGERWNNTIVLTPDKLLNETAYAEYGPLRMSAFFAFTYGIGFAGVTSVLTHTWLYHGKEIWRQFKDSRSQKTEDIHHKLMKVYPEVPHWWYIALFTISFGVSFAVIYAWPIHLPWWGLILAMIIPAVFLLPIGIICALTNQLPGLNVITEFIIGFALPGHPIANVTFKTYGYITSYQAITFVSDLKLGHYMKIPPRDMFWAQLGSTLLGGIMNLVTANWLMDTVADICTPAAYPFTCPSARTFYSASVIWGTIGPQKMFGAQSVYNPMLYFLLIGFLLPIPFYFLSRRYPNSWVKYIHIPLILNATGMMPPAVPLNFSMWCLAGFIGMYWVRKYHNVWWTKYNYVTSAALDSGVAISAIVIFGVVVGSNYQPVWWGNGGYDINETYDNCPYAGGNAAGVVY